MDASRGEVTSRKVVRLSPSSASTRRARSEKPSVMPPNALKKADRSRSRSTPVARFMIENSTPVPLPIRPRLILLELWKKRSERESMKRDSRRGASRKSSALRLGGVSSTSRS